jgi:hypothetical protein
MTVADELAATALLGTERRPPATPVADGPLGAALAAQPWQENPAAAVLGAAALATTHRRAGRLPATLEGELPAPAPPEETLPCPPGAVTLLDRLLGDPEGSALVAQWLDRVAARGEHAPPVLLPPLLESGRTDRSLRPGVLRAGGARAGWLAAQHPPWSWAAAADTSSSDHQATWETGSTDARAMVLGELRAADPAAARDLIQSTWEQDPPADRAAFLAALRDGLCADDEPLLERALADRRKEVRTAAADLLAALPGSAYRERMARRLAPLVGVEGRLRRRLAVELPPPPDADAKRDGIRATAREGLGERAAVLADVVAGAGLELWTAQLTDATTPDEVLRLARGSDHEAALRLGWQVAARRERHAAWCVALATDTHEVELLADLSPADAEPAAIALVKRADPHRLAAVLAALPGPWGPALSTVAVDRLAADAGALWERPPLRTAGARLHPAAIPAAITALTARRDSAPAAVDTLLRVLDLRQTLVRELPTP